MKKQRFRLLSIIRSKKTIIFSLLLLIFFILVLYYKNNIKFYERVGKVLQWSALPGVIVKYFPEQVDLDNFLNIIDFKKMILKSFYKVKKNNVVDLKFSKNDITNHNVKMELYKKYDSLGSYGYTIQNNGYIPDSQKEWRKADLRINDAYEKIKYKYQGTSTLQYYKGFFNLSIKHHKDSIYYNNLKRFNLINTRNRPIFANTINNLSKDFGLISSLTSLKKLTINNKNYGFFTLEEFVNEEFLEKEYGISDHTLIKTTDDWNRKHSFNPHGSDLDLNFHNVEPNDKKDNFPFAIGKYKNLLDAIKSNDVKVIKRLLDINYFSKFLAFYTFINNIHSISGDNLKLIYDHSSGKFYPVSRIETPPINFIYSDVNSFNNNLFDSSIEYSNSKIHQLYKLLIKDKSFREKRDFHLYKIVKDIKSMINSIDLFYNDHYNILMNGKVPLHVINFEKKNGLKVIKKNCAIIKKYLNHNKVFISYEKNKSSIDLSIINDSYVGIVLFALDYNDGLKELYSVLKQPVLIQPINIESFKKNNVRYFAKKYSLSKNFKSIKKLYFKNVITLKSIDHDNIYMNEIKYVNYDKDTNFENYFKYSMLADSIFIDEGLYEIDNNIIFPVDKTIIIKSGTEIVISKNKSMLIQGNLIINGTKTNNVQIRSKGKEPFGSVAIIGSNNNEFASINWLNLSNGSSSIINGLLFKSQLSINNADCYINNSLIENGNSDDGLNVYKGRVIISETIFKNNKEDQIDLDYCEGIIQNCKFFCNNNSLNGDGIDLSGSKVELISNYISQCNDKGISLGEQSITYLENNDFIKNRSAIAIKDYSYAFVGKNKYEANSKDWELFNKKYFYRSPKVFTIKNEMLNLNINILAGSCRIMESSYILKNKYLNEKISKRINVLN